MQGQSTYPDLERKLVLVLCSVVKLALAVNWSVEVELIITTFGSGSSSFGFAVVEAKSLKAKE